MNITINKNDIVVFGLFGGLIYFLYKADKKRKAEMEALENHKKEVLSSRNETIDRAVERASVENEAFTVEERYQANTVLQQFKRSVDNAITIQSFDQAYTNFESAIKKLTTENAEIRKVNLKIMWEELQENKRRLEHAADLAHEKNLNENIASAIRHTVYAVDACNIERR